MCARSCCAAFTNHYRVHACAKRARVQCVPRMCAHALAAQVCGSLHMPPRACFLYHAARGCRHSVRGCGAGGASEAGGMPRASTRRPEGRKRQTRPPPSPPPRRAWCSRPCCTRRTPASCSSDASPRRQTAAARARPREWTASGAIGLGWARGGKKCKGGLKGCAPSRRNANPPSAT